MEGVHDPFQDIQNAVFMRLRESRHKKEAEQRQQEAFEERQSMINDSVSDFNSGTNSSSETKSFEEQASTPADILGDTHKDDSTQADAIQDSMNKKLNPEGINVDGVNMTGKVDENTQEMTLANRPDHVPTERENKNEAIKSSMNESLKDKGIKVNNINSELAEKHGMDSSKSVKAEDNPEYKTLQERKNENIQSSMNEKLSDKGVKVGSVNSEVVKGKDVNPVKKVSEPKTETKRFKDDSGYVTKTIPNEPVGHITQGTGSQKSQSQSHDSRDDKKRPADLL